MVGIFNIDAALPCAWGGPPLQAAFKQQPQDFIVREQLGFEPVGRGEHIYVQLQKTACNTSEVVQALADFAGVKRGDVGYAGLKDKQSVSTQWFSLYLPKTEPVWENFYHPGCAVQALTRHTQKLRPGDHAGNRFEIRLRQVSGDKDLFTQRFETIEQQGFPNYFGEQRFGRERSNLHDFVAALPQLLQGTQRRGKRRVKQQGFRQRMLVSAVRAWLFNCVLAERIRQGNWLESVGTGDDGAGPLWGRGRLAIGSQQAELEQQVCQPYSEWQVFLEHCGLQQQRRVLCQHWQQAGYTEQGEEVTLYFYLPAGAYATSVLRELCRW